MKILKKNSNGKARKIPGFSEKFIFLNLLTVGVFAMSIFLNNKTF
jgi:hypothetical protein